PRDVDPLTGRHERSQAVDALLEKDRCAMEVATPPVMKGDADLQDAVVEIADRRARGAPEEFEGLVLLEELARVELLDALHELGRRRFFATCARGFARRSGGRTLRRPRGLARAATGLGRARARAACGNGARPR